MQITRRSALALFPLCALAACGVVSTTTTNGVTTITVDLVKDRKSVV